MSTTNVITGIETPDSSNQPKKGIVEQFEDERGAWTSKVKDLARRFSKIEDMVEVQVDLYSDRQIAVEYVHQLIMTHAKVKKAYNVEWKKWYDHFTNNMDYRPGEKEKMKLIDEKTGDYLLKLQIVQTHIDFMRETVKTIDNMIFGIKQRNEIEDFRRGNK